MEKQLIFKTMVNFRNYFAVVTIMDDDKVWVKYFNDTHEVTQSIIDMNFVESIFPVISEYCKKNNLQLWSY